MTQPFDQAILQTCQSEFELLAQLNHPGIVKVYDIFIDYSLERVYTVLERAPGAELKAGAPLNVFKKICEAVAYMHAQKVCHRDLKPDNILVHRDSVKIIDFNTAVQTDATGLVQGGAGLKEWSAPETRLQLKYTNKCDAWSLGLILAFILSGFTPRSG